MGYAQEYHVERYARSKYSRMRSLIQTRYLRESLIPRIAPVSRVKMDYPAFHESTKGAIGNDLELRGRESLGSSEKLLTQTRQFQHFYFF